MVTVYLSVPWFAPYEQISQVVIFPVFANMWDFKGLLYNLSFVQVLPQISVSLI